MANFTDTFGIGVGLGSSRSSSWLLALVSQVGVIGSALFGLFLFLVLATPRPRQVDSGEQDVGVMQLAFKAYMAGILVASAISGAVFDLGLAFYLSRRHGRGGEAGRRGGNGIHGTIGLCEAGAGRLGSLVERRHQGKIGLSGPAPSI